MEPWEPDHHGAWTIKTPKDMPVTQVAMLQETIGDAWGEYGGDPNNAEQFWNFLRSMTDLTANFFKAGPIYSNRRHEYQAPEQVVEFQARIITTFPGSADKRVAFGFARFENTDWEPTGFGDADWAMHEWKRKDAVPRETSGGGDASA